MTIVINNPESPMNIAAGQFKAECLKLMDRVNETHEEIIISKRGKAVAKLVSVGPVPVRSVFGFLKNTVKNESDIILPTGEKWDAEK
jgi:prevent-host-death family protein